MRKLLSKNVLKKARRSEGCALYDSPMRNRVSHSYDKLSNVQTRTSKRYSMWSENYFQILSSCVIAAIVLLQGFSAPLAFADEEVAADPSFERFYIPVPFCVIAQTSRIGEEISQTIASRLTTRFHAPCKRLTFPMDLPFSDRSKSLWREQSPSASFGFWADLRGSEIIVRAFDLSVSDEKVNETLLEWANFKMSIASLPMETLRTNLTAKMDHLIDEYPFVGMIEPSGFFAWTTRATTDVSIVKRTGVHRHPFLPMLFDYLFVAEKNTEATLKKDSEGFMQIQFSKMNSFDPRRRLWLKEVSDRRKK
jgi:hypothetical protein